MEGGELEGRMLNKQMDEDEYILPNGGTSASQKANKGSGGSPSRPSSFTQKGKQKLSFSELEKTSQEAMEVVPRFLVVKRKEGDFANISPFLIDKVLSAAVGSVISVRKVREGLLVETSSNLQSKKLMAINKFHDFDVSVEPHAFLNHTKGVITCRDLLNCSLVEIIDNMAEQGVIDAKRITVRKEGVLKETASLILTFNRISLPKKIKAGFHILPVRTYIPAPMRCFRCQQFGHTSARCNKEEICICGKEPHAGSPCVDPMQCVNCKGEHSARSKNCPVYKEEAAIQKIKTEEKISFAEARRRVRATMVTPVVSKSYSQAVTNTTQPAQSDIVIKDIMSKLVPEIVKICLDTMRNSNDAGSTTVPLNAAEKRKRGDNTPSDTECPHWEALVDSDEEDPSQKSRPGTPTPRRSKRGGKRGRPRRK